MTEVGRAGPRTRRDGTAGAGGEAPWYREWFGEEYLDLYPHRDTEEAREAVALLRSLVSLAPGARVLDLACGAGRHLQWLQTEGVRAVGLDLSHELLLRAREELDPGGGGLTRGDMRRLPFASGSFHAVTSFFTSFGYFETEAEDRSVLAEMRRVLRPDGHVLVDFLNARVVIDSLRARDERRIGGAVVLQERSLIEGGRRVEKRIRIEPEGGGRAQEFRERVRLYTPEELEALMAHEGISPIERFGSYRGGAFSDASPRVIVLGVTNRTQEAAAGEN